MKLTTNQFATLLNVDHAAAYALVNFLRAKNLITEAGHVEKAPGAKGKPATLYEFDPTQVGDALRNLFTNLP